MPASLASLNKQQKAAVTADDKRVLVIAGAGSGKTQTLLQKIIYLISEKGAKPSEILAITFTKNAANEMIDRLILSVDFDGEYKDILHNKTLSEGAKNTRRRSQVHQTGWIRNLTIRTFHSLCYSILKTYGVSEFDNKFKIITDTGFVDEEMAAITASETTYTALHKVLIDCCSDKEYLIQFKRYVLDYLVDKLHLPQRSALALSSDNKLYTSLNGTKVRSKSEQYIADWLYRHNIKFVYEPKVNFQEKEFYPDFFIPDANLYIEHISNLSKGTDFKEKQFNIAGKLLVKTYEEMTRDTSLFNLALERIIRNRLPDGFDVNAVLHYEEEFRGRHHEIRNFLRQLIRVLDMIKVDGLNILDVADKASLDQHQRIRDFYKLAIPLIERFETYCTDRSYLDFNDLNIKAINLLNKSEEIRQKFFQQYKYVLVDEFQDVNKIQVSFIKTLMNPDAQLFCVGDDWQSIYGFRGSDVQFIVEFTRFFKDAKCISLDTNYRSTPNIVDASSEVIRNNRFMVDKVVKAQKKSRKKIEVYSAVDFEDGMEFAVQEVKELLAQGMPNDQILFLYRRSKMFEPYRERFKKEKIHINAKTIHAAKGLESKVVFIIGLTQGNGGFPDVWLDDRIYQTIRPVKYDLLLEEERRLFYVALTRAADILYLITEKGNESMFIDEIPPLYKVLFSKSIQSTLPTKILCPSCNRVVEAHFKFCPGCGGKL
ncbi:MAG: UvrD-helicase domain-containing protein [Saprospiraceae bacterium]|nr:UvrD-helicase domain-containing protein [Saprospiraceae bacterium]